MITIGDLIDQTLPPNTAVVAGRDLLDTEVSWATRPRPSAPAFDHLSGGELVLLTPNALASLDQRLTLDAAIRQQADAGPPTAAAAPASPAAAASHAIARRAAGALAASAIPGAARMPASKVDGD